MGNYRKGNEAMMGYWRPVRWMVLKLYVRPWVGMGARARMLAWLYPDGPQTHSGW